MSIKQIFNDFKKNYDYEKKKTQDSFALNEFRLTKKLLYDSNDTLIGYVAPRCRQYEYTLSFGERSNCVYIQVDAHENSTRISKRQVRDSKKEYKSEDITDQRHIYFSHQDKDLNLREEAIDLMRYDIFQSIRYGELEKVVGMDFAFSNCLLEKIAPNDLKFLYELEPHDLKIISKEFPEMYESDKEFYRVGMNCHDIMNPKYMMKSDVEELKVLREQDEWKIGEIYDRIASEIGMKKSLFIQNESSEELRSLPEDQIIELAKIMSYNDMRDFVRTVTFSTDIVDLDQHVLQNKREYLGYLCVNRNGEERLMKDKYTTMNQYLQENEKAFVREVNDSFFEQMEIACNNENNEVACEACIAVMDVFGDRRFLLDEKMTGLYNSIEDMIIETQNEIEQNAEIYEIIQEQ